MHSHAKNGQEGRGRFGWEPAIGHIGRLSPLPPMWLEARFWPEYWALLRDPIFRGRGVPHGDGKPVLLIPGFLAGDYTLVTLRDWLGRMGYRPEVAGINFNFWHSEGTLDGIQERLLAIHRRSGRQVTVIGHSRGGLLAKVLADRNPLAVDQVIALGSPLADTFDIHPLTMAWVRAAQAVNWLRYRARTDRESGFLAQLAQPPVVPLTSIYTPSDGAVNWKACLRPDVTQVQVRGSHTGLAVNREVYRHLARLLAWPQKQSQSIV